MGTHLTRRQSECRERLLAFADFAHVDPPSHVGRWREYFAARIGSPFDGRLIVEIGCAEGSFLTRVAARHPRMAFVGIDWKYGDVLRAAECVSAAGLTNVAFVRGRAQDVGQLFAPGEVDEFWMLHPEPVGPPLFAAPFLLSARPCLADVGSPVVMKTDHAGYYARTLAMLGVAQPDWPTASPRVRLRDLPLTLPASDELLREVYDVALTSHDFWNDAAAQAATADRAFAGEQTPYEAKFVAKRRPIFYVELRPALRSAMEPMKPMRPMEPMKPLDFGPPWWPAEYGSPDSAGGQNCVRYAYFGDRKRLIVDRNGDVREYDTGDHRINGIQQAQGDLSHIAFRSQSGTVALGELRAIGRSTE